jgi:hypothetical protein
MLLWGLCATSAFVLSFFIGVRFGVQGVATAYTVTSLGVLMYPGFKIPFRLIGLSLRTFVRALLPQIAIAFAMALLCLLWEEAIARLHQGAWPRLISTVAVGVLAYTGLMVKLRPAVISYLEDVIRDSGWELARRCCRAIGLFPGTP